MPKAVPFWCRRPCLSGADGGSFLVPKAIPFWCRRWCLSGGADGDAFMVVPTAVPSWWCRPRCLYGGADLASFPVVPTAVPFCCRRRGGKEEAGIRPIRIIVAFGDNRTKGGVRRDDKRREEKRPRCKITSTRQQRLKKRVA